MGAKNIFFAFICFGLFGFSFSEDDTTLSRFESLDLKLLDLTNILDKYERDRDVAKLSMTTLQLKVVRNIKGYKKFKSSNELKENGFILLLGQTRVRVYRKE